jgi:hypothetical protein
MRRLPPEVPPRVSRFRIVFAVDRRRGRLQIMAIGHRRSIYEELAGAREKT